MLVFSRLFLKVHLFIARAVRVLRCLVSVAKKNPWSASYDLEFKQSQEGAFATKRKCTGQKVYLEGAGVTGSRE